MEFQYLPNLGWLLVVIGAGIVLVMGYRKKTNIMKQLNMVPGSALAKNLFLVTGLLLLVVAILGPRQEDGYREVNQEGLDIYVLVDTSKSMLATDIAPSRLERAKKIVDEMLNHLTGDRIGFIPYASSAYIQMPLTDDYDLARLYLDVMDTDMIGGGGTDVLQAIELASRSFDQASGGQNVILVLSDGEAHDMDYEALEKYQKNSDFKIYSIGIGTEEGSLIPETDVSTGEVIGYKKDANGDLVTSRLDEKQLQIMAKNTGGRYYLSDVSMSEVQSLIKDLGYLERGQRSPGKIRLYNEMYQWFLLPAIILVFLGFVLPERRVAQ